MLFFLITIKTNFSKVTQKPETVSNLQMFLILYLFEIRLTHQTSVPQKGTELQCLLISSTASETLPLPTYPEALPMTASWQTAIRRKTQARSLMPPPTPLLPSHPVPPIKKFCHSLASQPKPLPRSHSVARQWLRLCLQRYQCPLWVQWSSPWKFEWTLAILYHHTDFTLYLLPQLSEQAQVRGVIGYHDSGANREGKITQEAQ